MTGEWVSEMKPRFRYAHRNLIDNVCDLLLAMHSVLISNASLCFSCDTQNNSVSFLILCSLY